MPIAMASSTLKRKEVMEDGKNKKAQKANADDDDSMLWGGTKSLYIPMIYKKTFVAAVREKGACQVCQVHQ